MPVTVVMNYRDGLYAIDSSNGSYVTDPSVENSSSEKNILTWMVRSCPGSLCDFSICILQGTLLEKYLTMTPEEFTSYMRSTPPAEEQSEPIRESYRYAKVDLAHAAMFYRANCL